MLVGLVLLGISALCHATNNCAWINEATVSGLLGGEAVNVFTESDAGRPAVCLFTYDGAGVKRTLRVTVEIATDPHVRLGVVAEACGNSGAALRAIGNEAMICDADERKGVLGERVVGRVRDQVFTITLGSTLKGDPLLTRYELQSRIATAAEQVAGNLF